jgi:hypothetical protein
LILLIEFNKVTGQFTTGVGKTVGKPRSVIGTRNVNAITFSVNFGEVGSLCSWTGTIRINENEEWTIETNWMHNDGLGSWDSISLGNDIFKGAPFVLDVADIDGFILKSKSFKRITTTMEYSALIRESHFESKN